MGPARHSCPRGAAPRRILLLGLGGGAVLHQLHRLFPAASITAIEFDPVHIQVAKWFFGIDRLPVEVIEGDAIAFMRRNRRRFDLVIDDIFVDAPGDPVRGSAGVQDWAQLLTRHLSNTGVLIQNQLSPAIARRSARTLRESGRFTSALIYQTPHYANGVLATYPGTVTSAGARQAINQSPSANRLPVLSIRQVF